MINSDRPLSSQTPPIFSGATWSVGSRQFSPLNPYLIAEIGVNHEGSLSSAKEMIRMAAAAGAHAVKFQSYTAEKLASPLHAPNYWDLESEPTNSQFKLFKKYDSFSLKDFTELARVSRDNGVDFLSTPFDQEIAEQLAPLVPAFKVASADLTNIPLVTRLLEFDLPIIISTGAASNDEILHTANALTDHKYSVAFLHCVLNYPTELRNANLLGIARLQSVLPGHFSVGYSDHVPPETDGQMPALQAAFLMGASVIEKHFTDDRSRRGNDHYHAADPTALRDFSDWLVTTRKMMGDGDPDLSIQKSARENARRRIFISSDTKAGQTLSPANLIPLRANVGIEVSHWDDVVGLALKNDVTAGNPLRWADLQRI